MKIMKRNIAFLLVCTMLLTQGIYIPTAKAGTTSNNAVSIRTTDKDVVVSVSKDSPVTYSSMQEAVNSAVATQGTRVNTTNIDITDLSNWYV